MMPGVMGAVRRGRATTYSRRQGRALSATRRFHAADADAGDYRHYLLTPSRSRHFPIS